MLTDASRHDRVKPVLVLVPLALARLQSIDVRPSAEAVLRFEPCRALATCSS
jgi:hypothetical protein